jgi:hypothetical protein
MTNLSKQFSTQRKSTENSAWIYYSIVPTIDVNFSMTDDGTASGNRTPFLSKAITATDASGKVVYEGWDGSTNVTYLSLGIPKPIIAKRILTSGDVNGTTETTIPTEFIVDAGE